jgi:hypothetical protein
MLAELNCDENTLYDICTIEGLTFYPAFVLYQNGKRIESYDDPDYGREELVEFALEILKIK